ncbi:hypothetical protein ACPCHU_15945 [Bacillus bombysepticus]
MRQVRVDPDKLNTAASAVTDKAITTINMIIHVNNRSLYNLI